MKKISGFTVIELITVIGIIAIVSAVAITGLVGYLPNYRLSAASREVLSAIESARAAAIRENASVAVSFNAGNAAYHIWVDNGEGAGGVNDLAQNGSERSLRSGTMPPGVSMPNASFGAGSAFRFDGVGLPIRSDGFPGGGSVVLANTNGRTRTIAVSTGGNVRIQ
jgi:type IV fimbrial biogenesis protein FimT